MATCKRTRYRHHREMCPFLKHGRPLWVGSRPSADSVVQALAEAKPDAIFSSLVAAAEEDANEATLRFWQGIYETA